MSQSIFPESLISDLTRLIAEARTRAAVALNAEITCCIGMSVGAYVLMF